MIPGPPTPAVFHDYPLPFPLKRQIYFQLQQFFFTPGRAHAAKIFSFAGFSDGAIADGRSFSAPLSESIFQKATP
jgi:hypothetical protein